MPIDESSRLVQERLEKIARLRAQGVEPYPWEFPGRVPTSQVVEATRSLAHGTHSEGATFRVAGRILTVRVHGKSAFVDIADLAGSLQLFLRVGELAEERFHALLAEIDPGDIVGVEGAPLVTRRGEPSLLVRELTLLAKAIHPPPEKWHGLQDIEERVRRRYVDLLSSDESRQRFVGRSKIVRDVRSFLDQEGFHEVETSTLVGIASGAAAEPFLTHSKYLGRPIQLRISIELPLKRLLVGGLERVYELGRVFRNEDLDTTHSPEFTMLELYWAYADYNDMRGLVERLYARLAELAPKLWPDSPGAKRAQEQFHPPFPTVDYVDELERRMGQGGLLEKSREQLRDLATRAGAQVPDDSPAGKYLDKLFQHYVEPTLERPTFVLDFPEATTPLAKRHRKLPGRVERFELFYRGVELANAYTELNDPIEQRRRFEEQLSSRADESYAYDDDFVEALAYGMPPATGLGIGIDRMVMALSGAASIKDVILFLPTRPKSNP